MRRLAALVLLASLALAGCSMSTPDGTATPTGAPPPGGSPSPESGTAPASTPDPDLAAFAAALAGHSPADPEALVASIEAAGFERSAIERTRELDSLGAPVTFMEVAALVGDDCLIGQVGDGEPAAIRADALGGGRCLVGDVIRLD